MDDATTDADLIARAPSDPDAFRLIYRRHAVAVRAHYLRRVGGHDVANDLVAETFAEAWRSRKRFRDPGDGSALPWLYGIARNHLRHFERSRAVHSAARQKLGVPLRRVEVPGGRTWPSARTGESVRVGPAQVAVGPDQTVVR